MRPRRARARPAGLLALCALAGSPAALAQPGLGVSGPEVPLGIDLTTVALGSWAEYAVLVDGKPLSRQRYALVERKEERHTLEMTFSGGPLQTNVIHLAAELLWQGSNTARQVENARIQINGGQPMLLPAAAQTAPFKPLDPKTREAEETVTVTAGKFKATRHRERGADGRVIRYWLAPEAPPFGLVKLAIEGGNGPRIALELTARGGGARRAVTGPARPFDQMAFMQELTAATQPGAR